MVWPLMLWVSLVGHLDFYLNLAHHSVLYQDPVLMTVFSNINIDDSQLPSNIQIIFEN